MASYFQPGGGKTDITFQLRHHFFPHYHMSLSYWSRRLPVIRSVWIHQIQHRWTLSTGHIERLAVLFCVWIVSNARLSTVYGVPQSNVHGQHLLSFAFRQMTVVEKKISKYFPFLLDHQGKMNLLLRSILNSLYSSCWNGDRQKLQVPMFLLCLGDGWIDLSGVRWVQDNWFVLLREKEFKSE